MSADKSKREPIGDEAAAWVKSVLDRGLTGDSGLSDYEDGFLMDMDRRFARFGAQTFLSPKQRALLERIDAKLKKARRLEECGGFRATDEFMRGGRSDRS